MVENLLVKTLKCENEGPPTGWLMRQAGRYHSHYQNIRKSHTFEEVCKTPALACEVTMGPIDEFDFDAAILFSDILFPIEMMGVPLKFDPGPQLGFFLRTPADLKKYKKIESANDLSFQADALREIRASLPPEKALLGFVGGPLTLYTFAVEGSHKKSMASAHAGFEDGRFEGFMEKLLDLLAANMVLQANAGPDAIAIFETCAGDISEGLFEKAYFPCLKRLIETFRQHCPDMPLVYYGKNIGPAQWALLKSLDIQCLGVDHSHNMEDVLTAKSGDVALQGNFNPDYLTLPPAECRPLMVQYFKSIKALDPAARRGWVCGLGHGVLPGAYEENVHAFVQLSREYFG